MADKDEKPELEVVDTDVGSSDTIAAGDTLSTADLTGPLPSLLPEVVRESYEFGGELARGGMGRILVARDRRMGRPVVVKELIYDEPTLAARFEREALLTARLQHPAIVPIYEAGRWPGGEPFYAMKRVDGEPLDRLIDETETLAERLALLPNVIRVAEAIAYAHSRGIIHRDLKPANILVGEFGETVVIDWGLAKDLADDDADDDEDVAPAEPAERERDPVTDSGKGLTAHGVVLGTPAYMPPEQARGEPVDERADVYAIGALLYHAMSGEPTYTGKSSRDVLDKVLAGPPPDVAEVEPRLPADLATIINKAMAPNPDDRYRDGGELAAELRRFAGGQLVGAHQYSTLALILRWVRRHRAAVAIGAASIALLAVSIGLAIQRIRAEAAHTRSRLADLLVEQGRQELMLHRPLRAGAYFAEAIDQGRAIDRPLGAMLRQAIEPARSIDAVLERHGAPITGIAVSRDGSRMWTASEDSTLRSWSLPGGEHLRAVRVDAPIKNMFLSPNDDRMILVLPEEVQIWDPRELTKLLTTWKRPTSPPRVAFSPDGSRFVIGGVSTVARVQDTRTGEVLGILKGHEKPVIAVDFSPDGSLIITGSEDATARVWDASTFEERATFDHANPFGATPILAARVSPDDKHAITAAGRAYAAVWDIGSGDEIRRYQMPGVSDVRYTRDGSQVITLGQTVAVWGDDPRVPEAKLAHPGVASRMVLDRTGERLAVIGGAGAQMVWSTRDWSQLGSLRWNQPGLVARFTPDGQRLIAASGWSAIVWRPSGGVVRRAFAELQGVRGADTRGSRVMTSGIDGISVWDRRSARQLARIDAPFARTATLSPSGARLAYQPQTGQQIEVIDSASGSPIATLARPGGERLQRAVQDAFGVQLVDFAPDESMLAAALFGGEVHVWKVDGGVHLRKLSDGEYGTIDVKFSNDGRWLAVITRNKLALWDTARWTRRWERTLASTPQLIGVAFGPGDRRLAVSGRSGEIWTFGLDGEIAWSSEVLHRNPIVRMRVVDHGGQLSLISASHDHTLSIVDFATGELRLRLDGHHEPVLCMAVEPSGELIASASAHASIIWDARTGKPIAEMLTPANRSATCGFTDDGSAALIAIGEGVTMWDLRAEKPSRQELDHLRRWWKLERGNLVRR